MRRRVWRVRPYSPIHKDLRAPKMKRIGRREPEIHVCMSHDILKIIVKCNLQAAVRVR